MTDFIQTPTAQFNPVQSAIPSTSQPSSSATLSSDFETFLQMLTAQARFQDPLDPISSSDYAAQLAQFSMVEQQVFANDQLGQLASLLGRQERGGLAAWVGLEVRAPARADTSDAPITLSPNPAPGSTRVELVVRNADGVEVSREDLPVSTDPVIWDATTADGRPFPDGQYSFVIESSDTDGLLRSEPAEIYARVMETQFADGNILLKLAGGSVVRADTVTALREPLVAAAP